MLNYLNCPKIRIPLAIIPCFILWQWFHDLAIVQFTYQISQFWLALFHSDLHGVVSYNTNTSQWTSIMPLFIPNQVSDVTVYAPRTTLSGMTEVPLGALSFYSLGLPLWVVLSIGFNHLSIKQALKGFGLLIISFALAVGLSISHSLLAQLNTTESVRVFYDGYVMVPQQWPSWAAAAVKPVFDVSCLLTFLVVPIFLSLHYSDIERKKRK